MNSSAEATQAHKDPLCLKLRLKQRKFIKYYFESGNASSAALKAGYKDRQRGWELVSKLVNLGLFQELLEQNGLTDKELIKVLLEGLKATKVIGYLNQKTNGTQKVSDEFVEIPDYHCRHKYLEAALKLKGRFLDKKDMKEEAADNNSNEKRFVIYIPEQRSEDYYNRTGIVPAKPENRV